MFPVAYASLQENMLHCMKCVTSAMANRHQWAGTCVLLQFTGLMAKLWRLMQRQISSTASFSTCWRQLGEKLFEFSSDSVGDTNQPGASHHLSVALSLSLSLPNYVPLYFKLCSCFTGEIFGCLLDWWISCREGQGHAILPLMQDLFCSFNYIKISRICSSGQWFPLWE